MNTPMPSPYYQRGNIVLYHGDCRDLFPLLADASIDLVITSPPYNMRTRIRNNEYTEREWGDHFSKKYAHFHDAYPMDEYCALHRAVLTELLRIAPSVFVNIQVVTGSKEAWFRLIGEFAPFIKDLIIWDKGAGQPAMHESVINRGSELILALESPPLPGRAFTRKRFERGTMPDIWRIGRGGSGDFYGHAAVFPLELPALIMRGWGVAGGLVCDPFAGSGTTLLAARLLGRPARHRH